MKSMTAYAYREKTAEGVSLSVEIKGYNSRFLEIYANLPPWLSALEPRLREYIASRNKRGKIEISLRAREDNAKISVTVNTGVARASRDAILAIAADLGINEKPPLSLILGMEGVIEIERNRDDERLWKETEPVLREAADAFETERAREGKHTEDDILKHVGQIETMLEKVTAHVPELENSIKENLRIRFSEFLGDQVDENRVLAETAVLLMKYTISEEVSRLGAHLSEFRAETARNPAPGKKLDFLCQEINREINTIGSKSNILEVSRAVVEMKDALENVREQLRNVE
ncbi:MAG: YicC family protein [Treponema sp.]|jgi:uncharacterized protein (TIGR00255 family)|nr:YicC family protein [Treponema sp.]